MEYDVSDIDDWDSEDSESGVDKAAQRLDEFCQHISALDNPTPFPTADPPSVAGDTRARTAIPRVRAPSPVRVKKMDVGSTHNDTDEPTTTDTIKERWLTNSTLNKIETAVKQGRCSICHLQANKLRCTKLHARQHFTLHMCQCKVFSLSRDTIYRQQRQGRCPTQHQHI